MEPSQPEERIGILVQGRVQGVGFRWWTLRAARRHDVRGSVRNRADGSVEIHAAAPPDALRLFLEEVRRGPPSARISGVRTLAADEDLPADFRVIS